MLLFKELCVFKDLACPHLLLFSLEEWFELAGQLHKSIFTSQLDVELALVWYSLRHFICGCCDGQIYSFFFFFGVTCVPKNKVLTLVVGCLSWAAAASAEGKCNPPGTVQWGWTTAEACPLTACSGRYMTILRMRMMRWAMLTLSKMISMPVRWVSNLCLQVVYLMTSSYPNSGHQKKTFTFRRSNWALRGDPGTRRYKASGVWGHTFILIYTQSFLSSYL